MPLKSNFDNRTLLDRLDDGICSFNKKLADAWQAYTPFSKGSLEKIVYFSSAAGLAFDGIVNKSSTILTVIVPLYMAFTSIEPHTSKDDETTSIHMGLPKYYLKLIQTLLYTGSALGVTSRLARILEHMYNRDYSNMLQNLGAEAFMFGLLSFMTGLYMSRSAPIK